MFVFKNLIEMEHFSELERELVWCH